MKRILPVGNGKPAGTCPDGEKILQIVPKGKTMWKQKPASLGSQEFVPSSEPVRSVTFAHGVEAVARTHSALSSAEQAVLSQGIVVRGEISGVDSLYIDGTVEGAIHIPGERVTVGRHGMVTAGSMGTRAACITAREIVIMGTVTGNIVATERVHVRAEGSLTGDMNTARVSIEDGAYFRGGIDIRREEAHVPTPAALETVGAI
ncbi:MAG TPA: polymer-forming cytoskeletal protein [Terracidiphilus sp.]|nr:polymer-forming cytoskeletal protein [Terracidiphilus sp.]